MNQGKHQYLWSYHDDVMKWKHFPRNWPFVRGIHRSPVNSPHKGQWRGALMFTLICARINAWVNNREAGDLRRNLAHYDVIVMTMMTTMTTRGSWDIFSVVFSWLHWISSSHFVHDDIIRWKHVLRHWPLWWEFTGDRQIPITKASDAELWCRPWSTPE